MLNVFRLFCALSFIAYAGSAHAQLPIQPPPLPTPATPSAGTPAATPPVTETTLSTSREASNNQKDWHFIGNVEIATAQQAPALAPYGQSRNNRSALPCVSVAISAGASVIRSRNCRPLLLGA